jgi:integral membrane protein
VPDEVATGAGPGRLLVAVYGIFAIGATSRAVVQIVIQFHEAPLAYALSAFAAVVYDVATVTLALGGRGSRRIATIACTTELCGVLAVGTFTLVDPAAFPDDTVWSGFGQGYVFIPLILPVIGLLWLRHTAPGRGRIPVPLPETLAGWFRFAAIAEGITWIGLIGGIVLRATANIDEAVWLFGRLHGVAFIAYAVLTAATWRAQRWHPLIGLIGLAASVVPLATWPFEWWVGRHGHLGVREPAHVR